MRKKQRMGERAKACTSERPTNGTTPDLSVFSFSSEHQANRDIIVSVLLSLSEGQFQSLWDGMENAVPISELAQTLSSWVKNSAKQVLSQAMVEVKTMRATFLVSMATLPTSMGASPESACSTSVRVNPWVLETQAPGISTLGFRCRLEQPEVVPSLHKDKYPSSSSAELPDGDRNSMGDSWCSTHIVVPPVDSQTGQCRSSAAGSFLSSVSESEHSLTTNGGLSHTLHSVRVGQSAEGLSSGMKPGGDESQVEAVADTRYTHSGGLTYERLPLDTAFIGLHSVDNGSMCASSMPSGMDTLKSTMERMVMCVDNAKAAQERLETLFSSGLLKPFTQDLLDQIQEVICGKTLAPFHTERSASDPVIPPTRVINRRLAMDRWLEITWAYTQKVVRSLLREVLIALHPAWAKNEKDLFKTSPRPSAKVCADVVDIFTQVFVQQVMASLAERQADCSALSSSLRSHSSLASDITSIQSVSPHTPSLDSQGNTYRCLVMTLVVKLLIKIGQAKKEHQFASIPVLSRMLTNRVLFELCAMSGVSKSDAYPPTLAIQKVFQDVYIKLVAEFGTEEKLKRALCAQQLSFSKSLVSLLCDELLKQCRKKVADLSSLNRKVTTANSKQTAGLHQTHLNSGKDNKRKISTKASAFFKGLHTSKKLFRRSNQVRPDWGVSCQTPSKSVDDCDEGHSFVSLSEEVTAGHGHLTEDIIIDHSGSGDSSLTTTTTSVHRSSSPTLLSRAFDRFHTALNRAL